MAILDKSKVDNYQQSVADGPLSNTEDDDKLTDRIDKFDNLDNISKYWNDSVKDFYNDVRALLNSDDFPLENKLSDIRDAGNAFDDYEAPVYNENYTDYNTKEGNPYVKPNVNWIKEEYLKARADEIEEVLQDDSHLDFTIGDYNDISTDLRKYVTRLLMPQFKRGVEVEDLDRNFWVIGQNLTMLNKFFLSLEDVFSKQIIAELMGLWDNVYRIWQAIQKLIDDFNEKADNEEWADEKVHVIMRYDKDKVQNYVIKQTTPITFWLIPYNKYITELLTTYTNDEEGLQEALIGEGPVMIEHTGYHRKMSEVLQSIKEKNFILIGYSEPGLGTIWDLLSITYKDKGTISEDFLSGGCCVCNKTNKAQHIWIDFVSDNFDYGQIASYTETSYGDLSNLLSYDINLTIPIYRYWNTSIDKCKYSDFIRINKPYPKLSTVQIATVGEDNYINDHIKSLNDSNNWFLSSDGELEKTVNEIASNNDCQETSSQTTKNVYFIPNLPSSDVIKNYLTNNLGGGINGNTWVSTEISSSDSDDVSDLEYSNYGYYKVSDLEEYEDGESCLPVICISNNIGSLKDTFPGIDECPIYISIDEAVTTVRQYTETYDNGNNGIKITRRGQAYYIDGFWNIDFTKYYNNSEYEDLYNYDLSLINTNNFDNIEGTVTIEKKYLTAIKTSGDTGCSYRMNFDTDSMMLDIESEEVTDYNEMTLQYIITSYTTDSDTTLKFDDNLFDSHIASSDLIDYQHNSPEGQTKYDNKYGYTSDPVINLRYINGRKHDSQEIEIVTTKDRIEKPFRYNPIINFKNIDIGTILNYDLTKDTTGELSSTYLILNGESNSNYEMKNDEDDSDVEKIENCAYSSIETDGTYNFVDYSNSFCIEISSKSSYITGTSKIVDGESKMIYALNAAALWDDDVIRTEIENYIKSQYDVNKMQKRQFEMVLGQIQYGAWLKHEVEDSEYYKLLTTGTNWLYLFVVYKYNNELKLQKLCNLNMSYNFFHGSEFEEKSGGVVNSAYVIETADHYYTGNKYLNMTNLQDWSFKNGIFSFKTANVNFGVTASGVVYEITGTLENDEGDGNFAFTSCTQNTPQDSYIYGENADDNHLEHSIYLYKGSQGIVTNKKGEKGEGIVVNITDITVCDENGMNFLSPFNETNSIIIPYPSE